MLCHGDLCAGDHDEPDPLLLLPDSERAAREVPRDFPSVWKQERSESPMGLVYSRQVGCLPRKKLFDILDLFAMTKVQV